MTDGVVILSTILLDVVFPVLGSLAEIFAVTILKSIQNLIAVWNGVLLPAFQQFVSFNQIYVLPVFKALNDFIGAVLNVTLKAAAGLWQNVLYPALEKVANFVKMILTPAFNLFIATAITPLENSLKEVAGFLVRVKEKLVELTSALNAAKLPAWLTPGSPTPFELGLKGIAGALSQVTSAAMPALTSALSISPSVTPTAMPITGGRAAMPMTAAGGGGGVTVAFNGPINVSNGMDLEMFGAFVERRVAAALG